MSRATEVRLAVLLIAVAVLLAVGALWWWALLGMTPEVGSAVVGTFCAFGLASLMLFLAGDYR